VRHYRTGLFNVTRLRTLLLSSPYRSEAYWLHNSWSCYRELLQQVLESLPGITYLLTPAIQPFVQYLLDMVIELCQACSVAVHSIVVIIPTEFAIEFVHQLCEALVSRLFNPSREVAQRFLQPRPCSPTLEPILTRAICTPEKRKAQEVKAACGVFLISTETQEARFLRGERQAVLREPFAQHPVEALRITLVLEGADEVISIAS
jgi:hypothetical protein